VLRMVYTSTLEIPAPLEEELEQIPAPRL
jgi:hypothetical protein